MKIRTAALATAATVVTAGAVGVASASIAAADASTHTLGSQATLTNGDVVQGWTISDLKQSGDTLSYPVHGTLWEATATDEAVQGSVTPIVSNLNARSASGQNYRVLYQVATPQGVNPATLTQGQKTTGKVYFDVTGDSPDSVVYSNGDDDLLTWVQPAPATGSPAPGGSSTPVANAPGAAPVGTPAPAANPQTPAGASTTQSPTGSQGTPIPEGSQGTPISGGTQESPAGTPATPAPEGTQESPAGTPATPAPGATQPTPGATQPAPGATPQVPAAAPEAPAGSAPAGSAPAGSVGTPAS